MKIYLHIGAGKCGSSSIQNYFTYNNQLDSRKCYGVIGINGDISTGNEIEKNARQNIFDYSSSISLKNVTDNEVFLINFKSSLNELSEEYDEVVFSNEGWLEEVEDFSFLSKVLKEHNVEIILIVRSPVEWINSAWWQWGQWSGAELNSWISAQIAKTKWSDYYYSWDSLDFVSKVNVFSLSGDILNELSQLIGFNYAPNEEKTNESSDYRLLRFFKIARGLRKNEHSPHVEFSLNRYLPSSGRPDWVISKGNIGKIISLTLESSLKIKDLITNTDIGNDNRWWGNGHYKFSDNKLNIDGELDREELIQMLEESYIAIHRLDKKIRKMS